MKLTAYNKDVQKYMQGNTLSTKTKRSILDHIETTTIENGTCFEKLFPSKSKRKDVLDHIVYLLSGNGICKVESSTLAYKAQCSVRTVNEAVKNLKVTGEIIVAGLADGKNKYVFVLKSHENYAAIVKDVFYINAEQITEQIAEQKNAESIETVSVEGEKSCSNHNNQSLKKSFIKERITKTSSRLLNFVPKVFKEVTMILNTTDKNIVELWNVVKQVNKKYGLTKETIRTLALDGFNILKGLLKDSYQEGHEKIHNMFGKFNRIMHNVINEYLGNKDDQNNPSVKDLVLYDYITAEEEVECHWLTGEPIKKELPFYNWLEA